MICKNCNKNTDEDSKFCQFCGEKVDKVTDSKIVNVEKEFLDHLEFLGYEINKLGLNNNSQNYSALKHKTRPNLIFNSVSETGISFVSFYNMDKQKIKSSVEDAFSTINRMNNQALFCSFSFSPDLGSLVCSALYLGKYNKKQFADFLDLFQNDIQNRFGAENYLNKFI